MVVDALGRCWVGNFGFDLHAGDAMTTTELILVRGQHQAEVVGQRSIFPQRQRHHARWPHLDRC